MAEYAPGTPVICAGSVGGVGWVVRRGRINGCAGYWVGDQTGDHGSTYRPPQGPGWETTISAVATFAPGWCVRPAIVGETVCRYPWPHGCGLHHVSLMVLRELPAVPERSVVTVDPLGAVL